MVSGREDQPRLGDFSVSRSPQVSLLRLGSKCEQKQDVYAVVHLRARRNCAPVCVA